MKNVKRILQASVLVIGTLHSLHSFAQSQSSSSSSNCGWSSSSSNSSSSVPSTSDLQCAVTSSDSWGQGYQATISVTNTGSQAVETWDVLLELSGNHSISSSWDTRLNHDGQLVTASNANWNGHLNPGQSATFGIQGGYSGTFVEPLCHTDNNPEPPLAVNFSVDTHGSTIFVDARASTLPASGNFRYTIDFGNQKRINHSNAWHTYRAAGEYTVTVTLSDGEVSASSSQVVSVTDYVSGNKAPIAMLALDSSNGSVNANPNGSFDEDGDPLTFTWHTTRLPSYVTYVLTVFDGELGDTRQAGIMAGCGVYAHVMASANIEYRVEGQTVYVDGRESTNASGFTWYFGDGNNSTQLVTSHTYDEPGQYELRLFAHSTPYSGNASVTVNVGNNQNNAPRKLVGHERIICSESTITENDNVTQCSAPYFYDPDGDELVFEWNMGDGAVYTTSHFNEQVSHRYQLADQYTVTLTVSDAHSSLTDTTTVTSKGNEIASNTPPVACFGVWMNAIIPPPLYGLYDARCSTDADGDELTYSWVFGDGTTATGITHTHHYAFAGLYTTTLTVSDGQASHSVTQTNQFGPSDAVPPAVCSYEVTAQWETGFSGKVTIQNNSPTTINGWNLGWQYTGNDRITSFWNAAIAGTNPYTASHLSWNSSIPPGAKVEIGFQGSKTAGAAELPTLSGAICQQ